jgi:hypothetical protein
MAISKINQPEGADKVKVAKWLYKSAETRIYIKDYNSGAGLFVSHYMNGIRGGKAWKEIGYIYYNFKFKKFCLMRGTRNKAIGDDLDIDEIRRGLSAPMITEEMWEAYKAYMVGIIIKRKCK